MTMLLSRDLNVNCFIIDVDIPASPGFLGGQWFASCEPLACASASLGLPALPVGAALVGIVMWGSLAGSMLPFALRRIGVDPATSSAPFVATLVDVSGLIIYFTTAALILRGTLL
jgi:Mg/Co/Ni transporter MgtE